jgi:hypothetical protein
MSFATCLLRHVFCDMWRVTKICDVSQKIAKSMCTLQKIAKHVNNLEQPKQPWTIRSHGIISISPHLSSRTPFNLALRSVRVPWIGAPLSSPHTHYIVSARSALWLLVTRQSPLFIDASIISGRLRLRFTISADANPAAVTIIFTHIIPHVIRWIRGHVNKSHHIADLLQWPELQSYLLSILSGIRHPSWPPLFWPCWPQDRHHTSSSSISPLPTAEQIRLINLKPVPQKWREIMAQIILRDLCFDTNLEIHEGRINSYVK